MRAAVPKNLRHRPIGPAYSRTGTCSAITSQPCHASPLHPASGPPSDATNASLHLAGNAGNLGETAQCKCRSTDGPPRKLGSRGFPSSREIEKHFNPRWMAILRVPRQMAFSFAITRNTDPSDYSDAPQITPRVRGRNGEAECHMLGTPRFGHHRG